MKKENITLQPLSKETQDAELMKQLFNQPSTLRYWFQPPFKNQDELNKFIDDCVDSNEIVSMTINAIETNLSERNLKIGLIQVIDIDQVARAGEIEITILDKYNGHGYGQTAMKNMCAHMFKFYNMHKLFLYVDVKNKAAIHIYEKLGFKIEGTIKNQFFANGEYHDTYYMGLFPNK